MVNGLKTSWLSGILSIQPFLDPQQRKHQGHGQEGDQQNQMGSDHANRWRSWEMSRNVGPISGLEARFCYRKGGSKRMARLRVGGSFLEGRLVSALDRRHSALAWWVTVERGDWCSVCPGGSED